MATLTRTRSSFQMGEDPTDAEHRRPLHLDVPTPFPQLLRPSEHQPEPVAEASQGANGLVATPSLGETGANRTTESAAVMDASPAEDRTIDTDAASSVSD